MVQPRHAARRSGAVRHLQGGAVVAVRHAYVANRLLRVPPSPYIRALQVSKGFDVADAEIVERVAGGDLVVTADIPLAAALIDQGAFALSPRGEFYSSENIRERLALRDFMEGMRGAGADIAGPSALSQADRQAFANQLDRFLARQHGR
ncbi:MAG: DUF188 domain-containing protein [Thiobacillus sp.]|nr:DUF188 domain-containing protein [Thiobacillus sp.]